MSTLRIKARHAEEPERAFGAGESATLFENGSYYVILDEDLTESEAEALSGVGFEVLEKRRVLVSFGNYVGTTVIRGVTLRVDSRKLGAGGPTALLQTAVELAAELIYGWNAPLAFGVARRGVSNRRIPFHDFMFLRWEMLGAPVGERVQDYFAAIAEQPTRLLDASTHEVCVSRVQRIDRRGWLGLATSPAKLAPLEPESPFYGHAVARALARPGGAPEVRFMPTHMHAPTRVISYDTAENRFIRHFLQTASSLVGRFLEHPKLHDGLRRDARKMALLIDEMISAPFLEGVQQPSALAAPSQALVKLEGYRQLFDCYRALLDAPAIPQSESECQRFLDGRNIAKLYEYLAFLQVCKVVSRVLGGGKPVVPVGTHELGALLHGGLEVQFPTGVTVTYDQTYRGNSATASYSTALRPDVTIRALGRVVAFDAKYRLDGLPLDEVAEEADGDLRAKQADLHKMHTYRDAIAGIHAAFVVYPGDVFAFYEAGLGRRLAPEQVGAIAGVGAIPLRPGNGDDLAALEAIIRRIVTLPGAPANPPAT